MPSYMLDTDIASYVIKRSHEAVVNRLRQTPVADVCISVITKAELLFGVEISPRQAQDAAAVDAFLRHLAVLDFPDAAAGHYAEIRATLKKAGRMIGAHDLFIAAHARCVGYVLVTNNMGEFGRVEGLTLENWVESPPDR